LLALNAGGGHKYEKNESDTQTEVDLDLAVTHRTWFESSFSLAHLLLRKKKHKSAQIEMLNCVSTPW